jgi:hypothetical protein
MPKKWSNIGTHCTIYTTSKWCNGEGFKVVVNRANAMMVAAGLSKVTRQTLWADA